MLLRLLRTRLAPYRRTDRDHRGAPVRRHASRCSTCPASTPTSSTTASPPATPATSSQRGGADARRLAASRSSCSVAAVWFARAHGDGLRPRRPRRRSSRRVGSFSAREVSHFGAPSLITRETNDVQQVQMLVLMGCTMMVSAPIMMVGGDRDGDARGRRPVVAARRRGARCWSAPVGFIVSRMVPELPGDAGAHRRGQPAAARADHRHPRGPRVRPRAARDRALRPAPTTTSPTSSVRAGRWLAAMFPVVMLVVNVASRRGALVRRAPGRRPARCRSAR